MTRDSGAYDPLCFICTPHALQICNTVIIIPPTTTGMCSALRYLDTHMSDYTNMKSKVETPEGVQLLKQLAPLLLRDRRSHVSNYWTPMKHGLTDKS